MPQKGMRNCGARHHRGQPSRVLTAYLLQLLKGTGFAD